MPATQRQRVEMALRHARLCACATAAVSYGVRACPRDRRPYFLTEALIWARLYRSLRMVPLDAPDAARRARAALTVHLARENERVNATALLRCLRGRQDGGLWQVAMLEKPRPGRLPP